MDCQEWKDLNEGYDQFMKMAQTIAAPVTRCFAFDPIENQADNAKGLIMIPNVGNMVFYMSTMMNDFANEVLAEFSVIANRIQSLEIIETPAFSQLSARSKYLQRRNSVSMTENLRKRTPGRIRKLLADFYLLAGQLPDAIHHFEQAIDMAKMTDDYLWLASAAEGRVCATILLEYVQMDAGYRVAITNYAHIRLSAGLPSLVYAECCLRIARFLATCYLNLGWNEQTLSLLIQQKLWNTDPTEVWKRWPSVVGGVSRHSIGQWITKTWEANISEMAQLDQIHITMSMATLHKCIGYQRKAAWLMYDSVNRMIPFIMQHRRTRLLKGGIMHDTGIMNILKQVCETYGVGEALQKGEKPPSSNSIRGRTSAFKDQLVCGWPQLQVNILKQCINMSEILLDSQSQMYYTAILLKNFYQHISKPDQIRLATSIQTMVTSTTKKKASSDIMISYWGVNIVSSIEPKKPIARRALHTHIVQHDTFNQQAGERDFADPFIYNPFTHKKTTEHKVNLIKNELCEFKVVLFNPFGFDLELRSIVLSTSGVAFQGIPSAISIPANTTTSILLAGIPEETGTLIVKGCKVQIVGFLEQEFLVELGNTAFSNNGIIKIKKCGLDAVKCKRTRELSGESEQHIFHTFTVVDEQPLLKIKNTSLLHNAMMLYEGEMTHLTIEVENIGNTPVNYIKLSFTESSTIQSLPYNHESSPEEQYENELHTKGTHVFSWEHNPAEESFNPNEEVLLLPGETKTVTIKVYGKRDCCGGSIQIDYGYIQKDTVDTNVNFIYTRHLYLNILLTVYQHLEPSNWDILSLRHMTSLHDNDSTLEENGMKKVEESMKFVQLIANVEMKDKTRNDYCLIAIDVKNVWTTSFSVSFVISSDDDNNNSVFNISIQPGHTKRILLPFKRLFLSEEVCSRPIPSVDPNKQFIKSKISEEELYTCQQIFWYREELLSRIKCSWACHITGRTGILNIRPFVGLGLNQMAVLKKENIEFIINVKGDATQRKSRCLFDCKCNKPIEMNITIHNRLKP
ncbi:hypothetical protein RMCBS344292_07414 [Rhizopus microsporus]|nr:hypothetical protein RMCBS344292_07414 [Rhizopus microsporus]